MFQGLLVEHMQYRGAGDGANEERPGDQLTAEPSRTQPSVLATTEDDTHSFEFDNGIASFARHDLNGVLVGEIVASLDRV